MATIIDVAAEAGVSPALVSRYLNQVPGVSPKNREKIREAIERIGYNRNAIAKSLVQLKTNAIGVIIEGMESTFHSPLIDGIVNRAAELGYTVLFCLCRGQLSLKERAVDYFTQKMVDGILVYGSNLMDRKILDDMLRIQYPFVLIENDEPGVMVDKVLVDNEQALYSITRYLIEGGFRDVRYIPWDLSTRAGIDRHSGFCRAMTEAGLMDEDRIYYSILEHQAPTYTKMHDLLKSLRDSDNIPEAFVCGADIDAADMMMAAMSLGLRVPDDFSITGFDGENLRLAEHGLPELTTMRQPMFDIGSRAIEIIVDRIQNPRKESTCVTFQANLQIGGSVRFAK